MYARLCKNLSEEAPKFEHPDGSTVTFNRLLLTKCQEEFEQRRHVSAMWDRSDNQKLTAEEEEQKLVARRKMVGNLQFIGELGKLEIIRRDILHSCIQQLLEKKRHQTLDDLAEDLECLCQMMRTCGKVLDKPEAKNLMDQYFERMAQLSMRDDLQSRICFMLMDCIELREANWVPRKFAQPDGPRTIQQVRQDAARDLGVYIPPPNSHGRPGPISPLSTMPSFFPPGNRTGMEDVFGMPPIGAVTLGTGPGVIPSQPERFSYDTNGFNSQGGRDGGAFRRNQQQGGNFNSNNYYQSKHFNGQNYGRQNQNYHQSNYNNACNKDLPPRFMKMLSRGSANAADEVSLRPTSSMSLKPKTANTTSGGAQPNYGHDPYLLPVASQPPNQKLHNPLLYKEPPIVIKPTNNDKSKGNKKGKGPTKEEMLQKINSFLKEFILNQNVDEAVQTFKTLKLPDKFMVEVNKTILLALFKNDVDETTREAGAYLLAALRKDNAFSLERMMDGIKQVLNQLGDLAVDLPCAKTVMSSILSTLVIEDTLKLAEVSEPLEGGSHFPIFFLILQLVHKTKGKNVLQQLYSESKVNLMTHLPENDRTKEKLGALLEERDLTFLDPLLLIQADLWKTLLEDPSPPTFYKYIKKTLEPEYHEAPSFINALISVVVKYVTQETTLKEGIDATINPEKNATEQEKEFLEKFKPVLQAFLHDHIKLQVAALYALQVFTFTNGFPKGMLVRWFVYLYDLEIIDEEAFLTWKEDLSEEFPGKGKALFQVNQWLTWLQETEADEEEDDWEA